MPGGDIDIAGDVSVQSPVPALRYCRPCPCVRTSGSVIERRGERGKLDPALAFSISAAKYKEGPKAPLNLSSRVLFLSVSPCQVRRIGTAVHVGLGHGDVDVSLLGFNNKCGRSTVVRARDRHQVTEHHADDGN